MSDDAISRIHDTIQTCMNEGLLGPGMLTHWYLTGTAIDSDGDPCAIMLADTDSTAHRSIGLLESARLVVQQDIIDWHRRPA